MEKYFNKFVSLLTIILFVFLEIRQFRQEVKPLWLAAGLLLILVISLTLRFLSGFKIQKNELKYFIVILLMMLNLFLTSLFYQKFVPAVIVSFLFQSLIINKAILNFRNKFLILFLLICLFLLLLFSLFVFGDINLIVDRFLYWSNNMISVIAITLCGIYIIINHIDSDYKDFASNETFLVIILTTGICFMGYGRSGIVSSLLILFFFYVQGNRLIGFFTIFFVTIILFSGNSTDFLNYVYNHTKFGDDNWGGLNTSRGLIYEQYLQDMNLFSFFLGTSSVQIDNYSSDFGGVHNSWFNLHADFGISVILIFLLLLRVVYLNLKRKNFLLVGLILSILVRSLTDSFLVRGNLLSFGVLMAVVILSEKSSYIHKNYKNVTYL